jgi:hypothetical protein
MVRLLQATIENKMPVRINEHVELIDGEELL